MARPPRINLPDIPQHIIQRGNNREPCFAAQRDYLVYLNKLGEYADKFQVAIHAYVLMTNHVHILATPLTGEGVSLMMQALGRYYVRYFNKRHSRSGTLWEGRFKSSVIDSDHYFFTVSRYIELNPVRAGIVTHPSEYTWSSFHYNGLMNPTSLLKPHALYLDLGNSHARRAERYLLFFKSEIPEHRLAEIRSAINGTKVLGDDIFKRQVERKTGVALFPRPWGGNRCL